MCSIEFGSIQCTPLCKIEYLLYIFYHKHQTLNRLQFLAACKTWCNSVKNSGCNLSTTDAKLEFVPL